MKDEDISKLSFPEIIELIGRLNEELELRFMSVEAKASIFCGGNGYEGSNSNRDLSSI